ncbi:phage tail tape measure protein [Streptococcus agalactiae]|uniref:phage tail tape measure protein n=1 Tax=Streptococcus agalactiae TaxID=1311 RepID=UPI000810708F|nr:phage tail tape measure protein [Streptococcus agalactiae]OCM85550.1 phage tail tape measure protein [Streptococcus agalactiae]
MAKGTPLGSMFIELGLDTSKFDPKLQSAKRAVNYFKAETRALDAALKNTGNALNNNAAKANALQAKYKSVTQAIEAQKKVLTSLKSDFDKLDPGTAKWEAAAVNIERENAKLAALEGQLGAVKKAFEEVSAQSGFTGFLQRSGKQIDSFGQKMQKLGEATKWVSAGFGAGALYSVKAASDFESAFAGVKKTVDEVRDSNGKVIYSYDMLSKGIRNMSKQIPASTTEISHVAEAAGQLGIKTKDVLNFTRVMIDMGKSTNLSSEEAATALARFANITQLDPSKYSNLGSSIVELGNNFATTEKEIVEMGLRLAGTGKVVGLTDPQILGLATAMSSVGIEAEAGGSAFSRVMQKINTQVLSGGEDLWKFAKIAGKSADEFAASWKKNPQEAIIDFVKGLKRFKEEGKDVTAHLQDIGIESVREIDTLQRLAGAGDLLGDAFKSANKGFSENKALTDEASKRYATFQSKLQLLKNKLNDVAVTMGGPLMDAASNALDALEPMFKVVRDLAKAYSNASPEMKKLITYAILGATAFSPLMTAIGKTTSNVGRLVGWIGKLSGATKGAKAAEGLATAVGGLGANSATAAASVGLLGNPVTWGVIIGGAAVIGIGILANKIYEAHQRTQEWGTKVNQVQANELQAFKDKVDKTNQSMAGFRGGADQVNAVKTAFQGLVTEIEKLENKDLSKNVKLAEQLGFSQETIEQLKKSSRQTIDNVKQMSDEVINIYQNASNEHRRLTEEENAVVLANQNELINVQLSKLNYSAKEKKAITKAMNGELEALNSQQLTKALEVTEKWIKAENKSYQKLKSGLKKAYDSIKGDDEAAVKAREEIHKKQQQLEADHYLKMEAYGKRYAKIQKKLLKGTAKYLDPQLQQAMVNDVKKQMKELGLSYEELMKKTTKAASKAQEVNTMWARTTKKSTEDQKVANSQWNSLVWNPKTGKLKTNAKEEVAKALEAEGGWDRLKFIAKNANLETNARVTMAEVLVETGKWDALKPEDKKLIVDGHQGIQSIVESEEHLKIWNSLPEGVKRILGDNKDFLDKKGVATKALENWNSLSLKQQKLLAKDMTSSDVEKAKKAVNSIVQKKPTSIKAKNDTKPDVNSAQRAIDSAKQRQPISIRARNDAGGVIEQLLASIPRTVTIGIAAAAANAFKFANGTDYHPGGFAMVNDQKGPLYKELVTLPNGQSFIPDGRDVVLPLPKGSKVMKASMTRDYMKNLGIPKYANGVGIPKDSTFVKSITIPKRRVSETTSYDDSNIARILNEILLTLRTKNHETENGDVYLDMRKVGRMIKEHNESESIMLKRMRGELS